MSNKHYQPGTEADEDLVLYVRDRDGNSMGEIKVPAGHRVPPTSMDGAESYSVKE